jgi:hypothetical protein
MATGIVKFKKEFSGTSILNPEWKIFEDIFDVLWGFSARTFPPNRIFPLISSINASWNDEDGGEHEAATLEDIEEMYKTDKWTSFRLSSSIGLDPAVIFSFDKTKRRAFCEVKSQSKATIESATAVFNKYFDSKLRIEQTNTETSYINTSRIDQIRKLRNPNFDFSRLVRLCEELNMAFSKDSYLSTIMILRTILDHVSPVFGFRSFKEVASNYSGSGSSFKKLMLELENSSRNIADMHLHKTIGRKETLPNEHQVSFKQNLDALLMEIISICN